MSVGRRAGGASAEGQVGCYPRHRGELSKGLISVARDSVVKCVRFSRHPIAFAASDNRTLYLYLSRDEAQNPHLVRGCRLRSTQFSKSNHFRLNVIRPDPQSKRPRSKCVSLRPKPRAQNDILCSFQAPQSRLVDAQHKKRTNSSSGY